MTSQLVIRIDGYPDEVIMAGTIVGADHGTPLLDARVITSRITADLEVLQLEAVAISRIAADFEATRLDAGVATNGITADVEVHVDPTQP